VKSMETTEESMESMEMAPGALPHTGKVLEQRLLSPEIGLRRRQCCGTLLGETPIDLGFSHQRLLIGGRAMSEVDQGGPHHTVARFRAVRHPMVWPRPGPPPALLWPSSRVGKNRRFGLRFVQFREYFLCNFSETQKQQKIGNWHCGISLIG
jgi:hypothetical protein